uniref:Uncharacterized protein n=1 Tax=Arundo donax TaxID=35708 RepID=A0A0A9BAF3_ARUDO
MKHGHKTWQQYVFNVGLLAGFMTRQYAITEDSSYFPHLIH